MIKLESKIISLHWALSDLSNTNENWLKGELNAYKKIVSEILNTIY